MFRPPAEADSLILRVTEGCPWNGCTFCGMYKGVPYRALDPERVERLMAAAQREDPDVRRVFLADGDAMHLEASALERILRSLNAKFPRLTRVSTYANGHSIRAKSDGELRRLKELKLHTLYMGLESGDDETLRAVHKRESADEMVEAGRRAQEAGLRMSVMVLVGLAGTERSLVHARATARAVNRMQPRLLSALRLVVTANTPLYRNGFTMVSERQAVIELRELIAHLELESTVFRADHSSNIVPLEARFPKDRARLLGELDQLLARGRLDENSPGPLPFFL